MNYVFYLINFATILNVSWSAVLETELTICSSNEFNCFDGDCISLENVCDGVANCRQGEDEHGCDINRFVDNEANAIISRKKRQSECSRAQYRCNNGDCVPIDAECDGHIDCTDQSDETYAHCRNNFCNDYLFRCTYGACVDSDKKCNGVQDCADNSDEAGCQPRNVTSNCGPMEFACDNSECISRVLLCDGARDCRDGSDETVAVCGSGECSELYFRCAYGACVDGGSNCNGIEECADGSDEDPALCGGKGPSFTTTKRPTKRPSVTQGSSSGRCILPPYPEHGKYQVDGHPNAKPGVVLNSAYLRISCDKEYGLNGTDYLYCNEQGIWQQDHMPTCQRYCRLKKMPSVVYKCFENGYERKCKDLESPLTTVTPSCADNYYFDGVLGAMHCAGGYWNHQAKCQPECGQINPEGVPLVIHGHSAERGEFPWHAGIYQKVGQRYTQICGGSLITKTVVISAAHCFWQESVGAIKASFFAVAAGKNYRDWNDERDPDAQKSDASDIKLHPRFRGSENSYQSDIALVFLAKPFEYRRYILPVCVDFDQQFARQQVKPGALGKVAGWGLTDPDSKDSVSPKLLTATLPVVSEEDCLANSPPSFRQHISADKFCAGYLNGTGLCKGDSGGGLAFKTNIKGKERYFLRGIVSTAPTGEQVSSPCLGHAYTTFTDLASYRIEEFIRPHYNLYD